jgi:5-methylcytosine-specific restriction endonuclease McrA
MGRKTSVAVGDRFADGMLEVVEVYPSGKSGVHTRYMIKCEYCDSKKEMNHQILKKANSCGCQKHNIKTWKHVGTYTKPWQLEKGVAARNSLEYQYKRGAASRGLSYTLTTEQFDAIVVGMCNYCGDSLTGTSKGQGKTSGDFAYTGIDRVDNSKGYTADNVITCCWKCNNMKGKLGVDEFTEHVKKIHKHLRVNANSNRGNS